jgi:hypothetical protein
MRTTAADARKRYGAGAVAATPTGSAPAAQQIVRQTELF